MARNIEIKAAVDDLRALAGHAARIASQGPQEIRQDDTFFRCDTGRLKLRDFGDGTGQLIFYQRQDRQGPKESFYVLSETASPDSLRETLSLAYGQVGRVRKKRLLYMVGRTRVHLDDVEGLGNFMELEVVLQDGDDIDAGMREADALMQRLGIDRSHLIEGAYIDLLNRRQSSM
ncbi:class IV adenylate cyclase [Noviherbaspirillum sp.]|uniref:class IV adenylate cyclase n=1 Tax=Noviherbaspirillum sp. TaxID=1926288 RepID=UPI002FE2FFE2